MMRFFTCLLIFYAGFWGSIALAQTEDKALGPVQAIRRNVKNTQENCLANLVGEVSEPMYAYSCRLVFAFDAQTEFVMSPNPLMKFESEDCSVEATFGKGRFMMTFGNPKAPTGLNEAKICLEKGLGLYQNQLSFVLFKIDASH